MGTCFFLLFECARSLVGFSHLRQTGGYLPSAHVLGGYSATSISGERRYFDTRQVRTPQVQALCGELAENHLDVQFRVASRGSRGPSRGSPGLWGPFPEGLRKLEEI